MIILPSVKEIVVTCEGNSYTILKTVADQYGLKKGQEVSRELLIKIGVNILQSYNKTVAIQFKNQIYLDRYYWNYSKTTSKYVSRFLRMGIKEIKEKINSGEFKLEKFNY